MTTEAKGTTSAADQDEGEAGAATGGLLHDAATRVRDAASAARNAAGSAYSSALDRTSETYGSARDRAGHAYEAARDKASQARTAASSGIEESPFVAVVGGLAFGALLGALLPRTEREEKALGPIAARLADAAKAAASAAREAGTQSLADLGVDRQSAIGKVEQIVDGAVKAASSAGTAAAGAVRNG